MLRNLLLAAFAGALALASGAAAQNWPGEISAVYAGPGVGVSPVRCESWNYAPQRCPIDTYNSVQLSQVIAGSCVRGQTWTYDRMAVYVRNGCRAIFMVGRAGGGGGNGGGYNNGNPNPGYGYGGGNNGGGGGQGPSQNVDPRRHSILAAAQNLSNQAWVKLNSAQQYNGPRLGGHAARAKQLLVQANDEMKLAAQAADNN